MGGRDRIELHALGAVEAQSGPDQLQPLLDRRPVSVSSSVAVPSLLIGELIAMTEEGRIPLVLYPNQPGTAGLKARTVIDLHTSHIGKKVVLMFEGGDSAKPIVMGLLCEGEGSSYKEPPDHVEVLVDGERVIIGAKEQIVLRCGEASITLTRAGKVLIEGTYVLSRSSGVNRIKGGSVQIN